MSSSDLVAIQSLEVKRAPSNLVGRGLNQVLANSEPLHDKGVVDFELVFQNACELAIKHQDYKQARALLESVVFNKGIRAVEAMTMLGVFYEHGHGVEKDEKLALNLYLESVCFGYPEALINAGHMYADGRGCVQTYQLAFDLFQDAASQGHPGATFIVGTFYEHGHYVAKSIETAFDWYLKAANLGDIDAQFNVGNMYFQGKGTEKNNELARVYWRKAAEQGDDDAKNNLTEG
jgi:TPR repeat protein